MWSKIFKSIGMIIGGISLGVVIAFLFGWLVKVQNQIIEQRQMYEHLLKINHMELCQKYHSNSLI